jgi:hypothetical protein
MLSFEKSPNDNSCVTTLSDFRRIALSMPETEELNGMGYPNFRTGRKSFATIEHSMAVVRLTRDQQATFVATAPEVFAPDSSGWGRLGSTVIRLDGADEATVQNAVATAWRNVAEVVNASEVVGVADVEGATELVKATEVVEAGNAADVVDATEVADVVNAAEVVNATEVVEVADATEVVNATEVVEVADAAEVVDAAEVADVVNAAEVVDAAEVADVVNAAEVVDAAEVADVVDAAEVVDVVSAEVAAAVSEIDVAAAVNAEPRDQLQSAIERLQMCWGPGPEQPNCVTSGANST